MDIIDFRARPTTREFEYVQTNPAMVDEFERMGFKPKPLGTIEDFIAVLDDAGISKAVVPARDAETNWGEKVSNDYLASIVAAHPDRIIGFAGADPLKGRAAVEEIDRAIRELGLSGVSLDPCFAFMAPNDRRLYPLYEKCIELNVPVILTIGPLPIKPLRMKHGDPMTVDDLATDLPDLDIVCSHGGWPWTQQMIAIAMRHDNVWFENAGYHTMPGAEMLMQAANTLIPDKMLFATAFPGGQCETLKEEVAQFEAFDFEPEILRKVFHDNAATLLDRSALDASDPAGKPMSDTRFFTADGVALDCGTRMPAMTLAYSTMGRLNDTRDNAVLYCTHFGATHAQCMFMVGPGQPLDPSRHFIIFVNLTGNGVSASPSNAMPPFDGPRFPVVSIRDNVRLQKSLLDHLGVPRLALVRGHSMGALQTFEWGACDPDMVAAILPFCGAARVSAHNAIFLEGMLAILHGSAAFAEGAYTEPPVETLETIGRVWAPWAPAHGFYRARAYERLGFPTAEDFARDYWQKTFAGFDANDLASKIRTWLTADIASHPSHGGDVDRALGAISARAIVMPLQGDPYFPAEDGAFEVSRMPNAEFRPIPSHWGHWAGSGRNPDDTAFIGRAVAQLLG